MTDEGSVDEPVAGTIEMDRVRHSPRNALGIPDTQAGGVDRLLHRHSELPNWQIATDRHSNTSFDY